MQFLREDEQVSNRGSVDSFEERQACWLIGVEWKGGIQTVKTYWEIEWTWNSDERECHKNNAK